MSILKQNDAQVSKVSNNTDAPHDSEAYIAKAVEAHLKDGAGKHNANAVSVSGTYTAIPGTPTDLEATIAALNTVLGSLGGYIDITATNQLVNFTGAPKTAKFIPSMDASLPHLDAWVANAGNLLLARTLHCSVGTFGLALVFGGLIPAPPYYTNNTELVGTVSATTGSLNTARRDHGGCGTQGCALCVSGYNDGVGWLTSCEIFNGATWANTGVVSTARDVFGTSGVVSAALMFAGNNAGGLLSSVEKFNGSSWSGSTAFPLIQQRMGSGGLQNSALSAGGQVWGGGYVDTTYHFNGSAWTSKGSISVARSYPALSGVANAMRSAGGGYVGGASFDASEFFNGSVWAVGSSCLVGAQRHGNAGTAGSALIAGGYNAFFIDEIERYYGSNWNGVWNARSANATVLEDQQFSTFFGKLEFSYTPSIAMQIDTNFIAALNETEQQDLALLGREFTYSDGVFSAAAALNAVKHGVAGAGFADAALCIAGYNFSGYLPSTESFNGTIWSIGGSLGTARYTPAACGVANSAVAAGGETTGPTCILTAEKYNGATWSATGSLGTARKGLGMVGVSGSAAAFAGNNGASYYGTTETFNGATWSAAGSLATARFAVLSAGSRNAAICNGGVVTAGGGTDTALGEKFNGAVWSAGLNYLSVKAAPANGCSGSSVLVASFGGFADPAPVNHTELYNGSLWRSSTPLAVAKYYMGMAGTQATATVFGGYVGVLPFGETAVSEKWRISFSTAITPLARILPLH